MTKGSLLHCLGGCKAHCPVFRTMINQCTRIVHGQPTVTER
jgi:hypothetical protein